MGIDINFKGGIMSSGHGKVSGSFEGSGAAKEINLNFTPRFVKVINMTDLEYGMKSDEMGSLSGKEEGVSVDADGTMTGLATNAGIVLDSNKFIVGTDNSVNGSGDHMAWFAHE